MIWPWPDLDLRWPEVKYSNWPFKVKNHMFRTGLTRRTRWCPFYFRISDTKKVLMKNHLREKRQFSFDVLWTQNYWTWVKSDGKCDRGMRRAPQCFFFDFFLAIILSEIKRLLAEKHFFSRNLTFCDLWRPQYWSDLKMSFLKVWDLVAVYLYHLPLAAK